MSIEPNQVVSIYYTLRDETGAVIDRSAPAQPLSYLHGHGNLVPGLERELTGKSAGDKLRVKVSAADGYGEYQPDLVQQVPRRALKGIRELTVGMRLEAQTRDGARMLTVSRIVGDMVTLDGNHPLAGKTLDFEIEIAAVRAATETEIAHGHVHTPDSHHH
ncbi:MAG TPA: peptidylprolyl isomerase [Steroidobacteraceae bacterium]|nr:peptidylprolyl isomerase [Steroidobacteraceae bacterium]